MCGAVERLRFPSAEKSEDVKRQSQDTTVKGADWIAIYFMPWQQRHTRASISFPVEQNTAMTSANGS